MFHNPYTYTEPVTGDMFFGRSREMDDLLRGFSSREGDSFAIVGGRNIGKTSLLREIERKLLNEVELHGMWILVPVYLDLSLALPSSKRSLFALTARALMERLSVHPINLDTNKVDTMMLFDEQRPDDMAVLDFERIITQIRSALSGSTGNIRIVLLFDAFDQLIGTDWVRTMYPQLRALLSNRPCGHNLAVIMAGSSSLMKAVQERSSPLMNALRRTIVLQILAEEEATQLITQPLTAVKEAEFLTRTLVDRILSLTGGHPFLIQYLMWNLCELGIEKGSERALNSIVDKFPHERGEFADWFDEWGKVDTYVYKSLVKSSEPLSRQDIVAKYVDDPRGVSRALNTLLATGAIREIETSGTVKYTPAGEMFSNWFRENHATELVLSR